VRRQDDLHSSCTRGEPGISHVAKYRTERSSVDAEAQLRLRGWALPSGYSVAVSRLGPRLAFAVFEERGSVDIGP
jgi:hypothetical protein